YCCLTSALGPTATMRSPAMATAPSSITRRVGSIVMTTPPAIRRSATALLRNAAIGGGCRQIDLGRALDALDRHPFDVGMGGVVGGAIVEGRDAGAVDIEVGVADD